MSETVISKRKTIRKKANPWQAKALAQAQLAFKEHRPSLVGAWTVDDKLCVYNNNPYQWRTLREAELAFFRAWLEIQGIAELATAFSGDDSNPEHSFAIILDCGQERFEEIRCVWRDLIAISKALRRQKK